MEAQRPSRQVLSLRARRMEDPVLMTIAFRRTEPLLWGEKMVVWAG